MHFPYVLLVIISVRPKSDEALDIVVVAADICVAVNRFTIAHLHRRFECRNGRYGAGRFLAFCIVLHIIVVVAIRTNIFFFIIVVAIRTNRTI